MAEAEIQNSQQSAQESQQRAQDSQRTARIRELQDEVKRYRRASEDALQQLDWCIGYLHGSGKKGAVARLRRRRRNKSRPLWEMWFLTGLPDDRIGLFMRLHHVVADGIAGVAELGVLLDAAPSVARPPAQPWAAQPRPSARDLLFDNLERRIAKLRSSLKDLTRPTATLRRARAAMPALRELLTEKPGPLTSLNRVIGQDRTLAVVRSRLELVSEVAQAHDAKVNDVLLT